MPSNREFVYNLATLSLGEHVNMSSATLAHGESEFVLTGYPPSPSLVSPPRIAQTPVSMECVVTQYQQQTGRWATIGYLDGDGRSRHGAY